MSLAFILYIYSLVNLGGDGKETLPTFKQGKEIKEVVSEVRGYRPGPLGFPPNLNFPVSN